MIKDVVTVLTPGGAVRLRPKSSDDKFFQLFSRAAARVVEGSNILAQLLSAEGEDRETLAAKLHDVEHEADEVKHAVHHALNQTFVTPLDRDDISSLASHLDDCMDYMDEAGDLIVLYNLGDLPKQLFKQVGVIQKCAELTEAAMPKVRTLDDLRDYWIEINRLENAGDQAYRKLLSKIFDSGIDPITVIKLKDVIESLERCVDSFEKLANVIETIAIKES